MTEEELANMDDEEFEQLQVTSDDMVENPVSVTEETVVEETSEPEEVSEIEDESVSEETEAETESEEETIEPDEVEVEESNEEVAVEESHTDDTKEKTEESTEPDMDYKASYDAIMAPLNVSGKEVQVKSIDDLRNLANMGIDYSRKMRDVKPLRAIGETLTKAGILTEDGVDEAVLTQLIDIKNGDKDAITALMKTQNIDPLDMDLEDTDYVPKTSMVTEQDLAIADVETELVSRGSVDSVITEVSKLDEQSKQFFQESPANLLKLDDDIRNGVYEQVMGTIQYERSLGRLSGVSDIDAYIQIVSNQPQAAQEVVKAPEVVKPNTTKRKAAGISKRAPAKKTVQTYDYANMSDEEFEKLTPDMPLY